MPPLSHKHPMEFIAKQLKQLSRKELDMFLSLMDNLSLAPSLPMARIKKCRLFGICTDHNKIVWISVIKKPRKSWIEKIEKNIGIHLPREIAEYGYIYVLPSYRWHWITKRIHDLLFKKITPPLYAITKSDNIPMKKLLEQFGFVKTGKSFKSALDGNYLDFFLRNS